MPPSLMKAALCYSKPERKFILFRLEKYAIIFIQVVGENGWPRPFWKGGGMVSTFEAMYLMIAFATLVVLIIKKK